jgi:hypothetical protein
VADDLLAAAIEAHGGGARWAQVGDLHLHARSGGFALASKARRSAFAHVEARISTGAPRVVFPAWPQAGRRGVYTRDAVRIESDDGEVLEELREPRAAFHGLLTVRWDHLHLLYFAGYALWGYLTQPFLFARPGFEAREIEPWTEGTQTWRRLAVTFPADVPAHSRRQVFYFDSALRLRRNDYTAEVFGRWARGAHYSDEHLEFDGLLFPTRRRVYPRSPRNRPLRFPTLVWIDVERISVAAAGPGP